MNFNFNRKHFKEIENGEWTAKVVIENETRIAYYVLATLERGVFLLRQVYEDDTIFVDWYDLATNYHKPE